MNTGKILFKCLAVVLLTLGLAGCFLDNSDGDTQTDVLVSYEKLSSIPIPADFLDVLLNEQPEFQDGVIQSFTRYSVRVYKVVYKTRYKNEEIHASGAAVIPVTDDILPLLSYQHGTIFLNDQVPSNYRDSFEIGADQGLMLLLASSGYIVAAPDFIGYGETRSLLHPYHHSESTASASLDMLKATVELCGQLGVTTGPDTFLCGYSEGGYATLALQKLIQSSGAFSLRAIAAGAGAYDLSSTASTFMNKKRLNDPSYICLLFSAYNDVYGWGRSMNEIFRPPYAGRIAGDLFNGDRDKAEIEALLTDITADLFTATFLSSFKGNGEQTLKTALRDNGLISGWAPQAPLRLYHGTADKTVPPENSTAAYNNFSANGAGDVVYVPLAGLNHSSGAVETMKRLLAWFDTI